MFYYIVLTLLCILPYLYHVTASLRIRHATQAAKQVTWALRVKKNGTFHSADVRGEVGEANRICPKCKVGTLGEC